MKIKRLRLTGFKSFVEPSELRIEPGLTGVVGPNGCGKSNLLEAIRWVMGESSPKSMRGGGMDDVIFAGTSTRPARNFAEVAIVADLEGVNLGSIGDAASDEELEVIRRIERGQGSAYRANGRDVRAKDVALIFADAATGAHSPALVSQGKIAAVISAKPAERRQMLEEAAGIAGLHVRRKDAEQKLRATEANLERLDTVLGDMATRAGQLRRQARAAERYAKLSDQIRVAEARMIYARWRDAAAAADAAHEDAKKAGAAVRTAGDAQESVSAYRVLAGKTLEERREAAREASEADAAVAQKLARLKAEAEAHEKRSEDLTAQHRRLIEDQEREGQLARDAAETIARLTTEAETLTAQIAKAEEQLPAVIEALGTSSTQLRDVEIEMARLRTDMANEQADRRIAETRASSAREMVAHLDQDNGSVEKELASLGNEADLTRAQNDAGKATQDAAGAAKAAEQAMTEANAAHDAAIESKREADRELAQARLALENMTSERDTLEAALATGDGSDRVIDRIAVDKGYEQALAAALGDDLERGAGRDSAGWRGSAIGADDPAPPPGTQAIADFVQAPAELARRLQQVVVADADTGQVLAVGQRLVTRDGTLRRWDGFVVDHGGAVAAERLVRQNRLASIAAELPDLQKAVEIRAGAMEAAGHAVETAAEQLSAARERRETCDGVLRTARRAREDAETAYQRWQARSARLRDRKAELAARLETATASATEAEQALSALPGESGTREALSAVETRAAAIRATVAAAKEDEQSVRTTISQGRERLAAVTAESDGWTARTGEAAKRVEAMQHRTAELSAQIEQLADMPDTLAADIASLETAQAELATKREDLTRAEQQALADLTMREEKLTAAREALSSAREARAGAEARAEAQDLRRVEMGRVANERFECPPPLLPKVAEFEGEDVGDPQEESRSHEKLTGDRERIGPVNLVAAQELEELDSEHATSAEEAEELRQAVHRLRGSIGSLNREGRTRLKEAFTAVDAHFQRLFTTLFNGGAAHLELVDSDDPLEAGLEIMAQPPGKKLSTLTLLSGGEQALTAIALIFALFLTNPAPICVLDEVDAPLDDANIDRFCDLLDKMVAETRTRYLIVTHNAVTMSRMHRLFGVTMVEQGVSRLVSVDLGTAEELVDAPKVTTA